MPKLIIIAFLSVFTFFSANTFAGVPQALANAQAGLEIALKKNLTDERKYLKIEKRENGILLYKISIRRLDETTIRIRIMGYDELDEVSILTYTILKKKQ